MTQVALGGSVSGEWRHQVQRPAGRKGWEGKSDGEGRVISTKMRNKYPKVKIPFALKYPTFVCIYIGKDMEKGFSGCRTAMKREVNL